MGEGSRTNKSWKSSTNIHYYDATKEHELLSRYNRYRSLGNKRDFYDSRPSHPCPWCSLRCNPPDADALPVTPPRTGTSHPIVLTRSVPAWFASLEKRCFTSESTCQLRLLWVTSSAAQGVGGSFKNRKPIGEVGCCESRMAERIHWWTERWLELCFLEWLQWLQWSAHHNCWM